MNDHSYSLCELADLLGCKLIGNKEEIISGLNTLEEALPGDLSFLANVRYKPLIKKSSASAIICKEPDDSFPQKNFLLAPNPSETFQKLLLLFGLKSSTSGFSGLHSTAIIHKSVILGENVTAGPYAVIDQGVEIAAGTVIGAHTFIGAGTKIGKACVLHPHVTIREKCRLGSRVIVQPGAVIGSCGFGYLPDESGKFHKLEQLGIVILEDDVEVGANTTIDRARFKATIIKKGTKLDNLIQIAHNVEIGENNMLAAQTGIAGSTKTGDYVMMGGQVGIVGHVSIASQTKIATRGGVNRSLDKGVYRGSPVFPIQEYNRQKVHVKRLASYVKKLEELEKRLKKLEES